MADVIQLLPDSVANQIAAGEVIQRPSSVVKELVENAVDAGAKHIDVMVEDAGKSSILVVDDGKGMSETDARLAFERHATSKIRQASDLFSLRTMGFRGEALPSIAAVSQVTLKTHAQDQPLGTVLNIEGGKVVSQDIDACAVGSSFMVQNLFFNIPARRKFLKSNQTELSNIIQELERIVLVNPEIQFTFHHNGALQNTYSVGTMRQRVAAVFGKKLGDGLLDVNVVTSLCSIQGFVGRPDTARRRGVPQFFFVNGRYMRHPYFQKAVQTAFDNLIPTTDQVPFFLYFTVEPSTIDVNIHPTKTEIKFENEQAIWQIVLAAVRESLGKFNAVPTIEFDPEAEPSNIPVFTEHKLNNETVPRPRVDSNYNPFASPSSVQASRSSVQGWQKLYDLPCDAAKPVIIPKESEQQVSLFANTEDVPMQRSHMHYHYRGQYILTETEQGLMLIDQRRAHIRILYNRYMHQMQNNRGVSQKLLFPEIVNLTTGDAALVGEIQDELSAMGFDLSSLGGGSFTVSGIPADLQNIALQQLFDNMVASLREGSGRAEDELRHRLALTMARSAAIPVGQALSQPEMEQMLVDLFQTANPNLTPNGETIMAFLSHERIGRMF